jgi:hypothetical protein
MNTPRIRNVENLALDLLGDCVLNNGEAIAPFAVVGRDGDGFVLFTDRKTFVVTVVEEDL